MPPMVNHQKKEQDRWNPDHEHRCQVGQGATAENSSKH